MTQHIGIVACSAEGAALCYRTICLEALPLMGEHNHPQITMHSIPMAEFIIGGLLHFMRGLDVAIDQPLGYDDVDRAKELVGYDFAVPESDRVPLEEDEFYDWELEGCTVKIGDKSIGQVRSVMRTGGAAAVLVVTDDSGREQLVPLAAEIVVSIDKAARVILIDPPEGLLDL